MVQCIYPDQKVCTSSISYGSFEEGFDHVTVDFFPTFDEQLEFLGFLFDQVLCFGRILGQVVEFHFLGVCLTIFMSPTRKAAL